MKKVRQHKILFAVIFLIIVAIVVVISIRFTHKGSNSTYTKQRESTLNLKKMDLTKSISATGTIESKQTKTVSSNVNGLTIQKVYVSIGDSVKKGDTLATFDKSELQETLESAKEDLSDAKTESAHSISSAQSQLSEAQANYSDSKSSLARQVSDAKKDWTQAKKQAASLKKQLAKASNALEKKQLQEKLTTAREKVNQAKTSYENAVSNRKNTNAQNKSNISNAKDALYNAQSSAKKNIKEAQTQVDEASENLKKCTITAPISGIITAANVESGDIYTSGDMFQIDDTSSFTVSTTVDEYDISNVKVGQRVVILTEATDSDELEGKITFIAPSTTSSTQTNENMEAASASTSSSEGYNVTVTLTGSDNRLKMGLTAKCSIILEEVKDVFAVPYDAIHKDPSGGAVIYVSDHQSKREISVTKGMESDYYVEISDDLSEGLSVIIPTDETSTKESDDSQDNKLENMLPRGGNREMKENGGGDYHNGGAPNR